MVGSGWLPPMPQCPSPIARRRLYIPPPPLTAMPTPNTCTHSACLVHDVNHSRVLLTSLTNTRHGMRWGTQGGIKCDTWRDNWTVVTKDRGLCAQFEHTILITETGADILTRVDA